MRKPLALLLLLWIGFLPPSLSRADEESASAPAETKPRGKETFRFSGELRQETAFRISSPRNFSKIKEWVKLDFKTKFNDHFQIKFGARAFYDAVYDATDQYSAAVSDNLRKELMVRDAYLDILYPKVNIRLGSQQIVWGEALGQFFADVVNPKDLREFFLPAFEEVRIPVWAIDLRYHFAKDATLELVASPDLRMDKIPLPGSEFAFFIPPPPPGVTQVIEPDDSPSSDFKHWNGGARISYLVKGWDLTGFYYTSPDHVPVLFKSLSVDPTTGQPILTLTPRHKRVHQLGATFSKGVGPTIVRGEFVYTPNRYFNAQNIAINQGVTQGHQLRYMIGMDYPIAGKVDWNLEFQQQAILGSDHEVSDSRVNSWIFTRFETGFLGEKLVPELIFIVGLNKGDTQISPRLHYKVTPGVTLTWGADLFTGALDQLYGEFRDHKRIYMNTSYKF